jgi:hypothetical protein
MTSGYNSSPNAAGIFRTQPPHGAALLSKLRRGFLFPPVHIRKVGTRDDKAPPKRGPFPSVTWKDRNGFRKSIMNIPPHTVVFFQQPRVQMNSS